MLCPQMQICLQLVFDAVLYNPSAFISAAEDHLAESTGMDTRQNGTKVHSALSTGPSRFVQRATFCARNALLFHRMGGKRSFAAGAAWSSHSGSNGLWQRLQEKYSGTLKTGDLNCEHLSALPFRGSNLGHIRKFSSRKRVNPGGIWPPQLERLATSRICCMSGASM